jgi:HEAT repeat protein
METFAYIADAVIILTLAVIVLSAFAVFSRYLSDLREERIQLVRRRMQRRLGDFMAGSTDVQAVVREMSEDHDVALSLLIDTASRLSRAERMQLRVLFDHFQFVQKEMAALQGRRWAQRMRAATRLGYMNHENAIPALMRALNDEYLDVRLAAAHALAQLGAIQTVRSILRSLALPSAWPLQRSAEILYEMGAEVIDPLLNFLGDKNPLSHDPSVVVAVRVLGMLRARRAAPRVKEFLRSEDPELRLSSAKALGQMGDSQVAAALCTSLEDPVWEVRSAAAQALGLLGGPTAVSALGKVLPDSAWWVRFNAAESLYRQGPEGQTVLKTTMTNHPDGFARDISRQILEEHSVIAEETLPA